VNAAKSPIPKKGSPNAVNTAGPSLDGVVTYYFDAGS
jgi:hypothetical protein